MSIGNGSNSGTRRCECILDRNQLGGSGVYLRDTSLDFRLILGSELRRLANAVVQLVSKPHPILYVQRECIRANLFNRPCHDEILLRLHRFAQLLGLEVGDERVDDCVEVAVHDLGEVVHGQADAVIGDAVLREVVRADFF